MKKDKHFVNEERLDIRHPKNVKAWQNLDSDMKEKLKRGADLFVKNVAPVLKKLSKE